MNQVARDTPPGLFSTGSWGPGILRLVECDDDSDQELSAKHKAAQHSGVHLRQSLTKKKVTRPAIQKREQQQNCRTFQGHQTIRTTCKSAGAEYHTGRVKSTMGETTKTTLPTPSAGVFRTGSQLTRNWSTDEKVGEISYWDGYGGDLGVSYMSSLCELVDRYVGLDTDDELLCYICSSKDSDQVFGYDSEGERLMQMIRARYVLVKPVTLVSTDRGVKVIGDYRYRLQRSSAQKDQAQKYQRQCNQSDVNFEDEEQLINISAENFLQKVSIQKRQYSKILLHNVIPSLKDLQTTISSITQSLQSRGRLLIIHRPGSPLNTLPLPSLALEALGAVDAPVAHIMELLKEQGLHVSCEIEHIQVTIPTQKWMYLIDKKFPPPLQKLQQYSRDVVDQGLEELRRGTFRYAGPWVQFTDRLFFITAFHKHCSPFNFIKPPSFEFTPTRPLAPIYGRVVPERSKRTNAANQSHISRPASNDIKIQADVPEELEDYVIERKKREVENEAKRRLWEERRL